MLHWKRNGDKNLQLADAYSATSSCMLQRDVFFKIRVVRDFRIYFIVGRSYTLDLLRRT